MSVFRSAETERGNLEYFSHLDQKMGTLRSRTNAPFQAKLVKTTSVHRSFARFLVKILARRRAMGLTIARTTIRLPANRQ